MVFAGYKILNMGIILLNSPSYFGLILAHEKGSDFMSKALKLVHSNGQSRSSSAHKKNNKSLLLNEAFSELKSQTGIDFRKVITGDEKENKRLKFKHYQEKLLEG